jgi:endoglucanase
MKERIMCKIASLTAFWEKFFIRRALPLFVMLFISTASISQKPAAFLSHHEMSASGGQVYDEFYWLNTNKATLSKTVTLAKSGSYRIDFSAYRVKGTPSVAVMVDGVGKGLISITDPVTKIYSVFVSSLGSGTHTITLQLFNFYSGSNHLRIGLVYITQTTLTQPGPVAATSSSSGYKTSEDFKWSKMRGFNFSAVHTLSQLKAKNIPAARATGANVGRYWITISHDANNVYSFTNPQMLTTLDSALKIAEKVGMYIILTLQVLPEQGACDLWTSSARRAGVKQIWQQLATRYKNKKIIAAYDLINEPRGTFNYAAYLRWQMELVEAIRAIDPYHAIAIECLSNNMYSMMLPLPYPNLIYSPHSYSPLSLTHQGMNAYVGGTATQSRAAYPSTSNPAYYMSSASSLANVKSFAKRFNVPIWIGEFSCINWAPVNSLGQWTSTRWIQDEINVFETEGWSWCYHAWREFEAWDAEIPSGYYTRFAFKNAAPFTSKTRPTDWSNQRTSTAPTITLLKKKFALNNKYALL